MPARRRRVDARAAAAIRRTCVATDRRAAAARRPTRSPTRRRRQARHAARRRARRRRTSTAAPAAIRTRRRRSRYYARRGRRRTRAAAPTIAAIVVSPALPSCRRRPPALAFDYDENDGEVRPGRRRRRASRFSVVRGRTERCREARRSCSTPQPLSDGRSSSTARRVRPRALLRRARTCPGERTASTSRARLSEPRCVTPVGQVRAGGADQLVAVAGEGGDRAHLVRVDARRSRRLSSSCAARAGAILAAAHGETPIAETTFTRRDGASRGDVRLLGRSRWTRRATAASQSNWQEITATDRRRSICDCRLRVIRDAASVSDRVTAARRATSPSAKDAGGSSTATSSASSTEGAEIASEGAQLLAPVQPSKIVCVGLTTRTTPPSRTSRCRPSRCCSSSRPRR